MQISGFYGYKPNQIAIDICIFKYSYVYLNADVWIKWV